MNAATCSVRKLAHFVAFQGSEFDEDLFKEIQIAHAEYYGHGFVEKLYRVVDKIKDLKLSTNFTFTGINKWKYICSILLEIFGQEYKHGHRAGEINELLFYIIKNVKESRITDLYNSINITEQNRAYVILIDTIMKMDDDEFAKYLTK
jgi:hypothetical protein